MGTLGCINDMLRRDKENRELRQRNRDRMKDTYSKLLDVGNKTQLPSSSIEELEDIQKKIAEKKAADRHHLLQIKLIWGISILCVLLLGWLLFSFL